MARLTPRLSVRLFSALALVLASAPAAWGQMPITACGTITSSLWRLTQDITVTLAGDDDACLRLVASNTVIDLRGHTITGTGQVGYGILGITEAP